jgi:hypothetical protein
MAAISDDLAFTFNWQGAHPFYYHENDWYLPEEEDLNYLGEECAGPQFAAPYFKELGCYQLLQAPPAIPLHVDHRYGDVDYYPNKSYVTLLDDGSVVIGDGFGSQLRMGNGNIYLQCPGDVFL